MKSGEIVAHIEERGLLRCCHFTYGICGSCATDTAVLLARLIETRKPREKTKS